EPQTGRREVSALTDARKTLAYDFFRILRAPQYIYLLRDDIFISKMLQIHHHETDHRKQVTRLGIPFRPEHPYETHARLLLL
ncbi:hypothetical protein DS992_26580, partial [Escherichia coli]